MKNPLPPRLAKRSWREESPFLKKHGHEVLNSALSNDDFEEAVRIRSEFDQHASEVVVGSSRGGGVEMYIESGSTTLVLLCPRCISLLWEAPPVVQRQSSVATFPILTDKYVTVGAMV